MLKWISNIIDPVRPEERDAERVYSLTMKQSRKPEFFGPGRMADDYDGRIDLLSLNLSLIMAAVRQFDQDGKMLSQSLYDHMIDDFDIALREEGISDTGIKRRIKPMAALFFTRIKQYTEALDGKAETFKDVLANGAFKDNPESEDFISALSQYAKDSHALIASHGLDQIAAAEFVFSDLKL